MIWFAAVTVAVLVLAALVEYLIALAAASRPVPVRVHDNRGLRRPL